MDPASEKTILLEDNLFYLPATAIERKSTHDCEVRPAQAVTDSSNDYLFVLPASHNEFISLADIRFLCDLEVKPSLLTDFNQNLHTYCPINNIMHSLFESVTVELNGRCISDSGKMYFIRAYLENLLGFSVEAQKSQLTSARFYLDDALETGTAQYGVYTAGAAGAAGTVTVANKSAQKRRTLIKNKVQLAGKLHCDIFQQEKPLICGVEMQIKMTRARTNLTFCAPTEGDLPTVIIRNPRLMVRKYEPSPTFLNSVAKTLLSKPVKYHIERVQMRQTTLSLGIQSANWNNLACGQIPKTVILGITTSSGFNGSCTETPFNFGHHDLAYLSAEIDGVIYPSRGYNMDFDTFQYLEAYEGLLDTLERTNDPSGELAFDRSEFVNGFVLYGFDFTVSHTGRGALSLIRNGNLNLNLRFKRPITKTLVVVAMLALDNVIQIPNNRQVIFDYAP